MPWCNEKVISRTIYAYTYNVYVFTPDRKVREVKVYITAHADAKETRLETQVKKKRKAIEPDCKYLDKEELTRTVYYCKINESEFFETSAKCIQQSEEMIQ